MSKIDRVPAFGRAAALTLATALVLVSPVALRAQAARTPRADSLREVTRLDVEGSTIKARELLTVLIATAPDPANRAAAQRQMAMSYGFDGDCANAAKYEEMVIAYWVTREQADPQNAFYQQGEMANEAARLCIDAGDFVTAERLYQRGTSLGLKEPAPKTHPKSLWDYRLAHALGRVAARKGNRMDAQRNLEIARAILASDSVMASAQARYLPYLAGYIALYTSDFATAESELTKATQANPTDPFMLCLLAMTYEKMGQLEKVKPLYQKAFDLATAHNPPSAFARPFARKKLATP